MVALMLRPRCLVAWGWAASLCVLVVGAAAATGGAPCTDAASCQQRLELLVGKLQRTQEGMKSKRQTMDALEGFRSGLMHGQRVDLPSPQRQHLEKGSPLVGMVSYDEKYRPVSTNVSQHLRHVQTIAAGTNIRLHGLLPVRHPSAKSGAGQSAFVATIEGESKLSLHSQDGKAQLSDFDLGHHVAHMSLSANPDHSYVLTAEGSEKCEMRAVMVELVMRNATAAEADADEEAEKDGKKRPKKKLVVVASTTATFALPSSGDGRRITSVLSVDRGSQPLFLAGDSLGSVAVFFKNGTLKGRVKVTEDPGGVKGLLRGQGQTVLFYSSHSFGFLSVAQVDVLTQPCTGWSSPVFDIANDPLSTYSRVVVALSDGDVLVFSTETGKSKDKACDLTLKFPRLSVLPFRLYALRGHVMGLPTPLESTKQPDEHNRELYFFNMNAMEAGYGSAQSRIVTLQASFEPRRVQSFALQQSAGSSSGPPAAPKVHLAVQFAEERSGLELYELNLKTPPLPSRGGGGGDGGGSGSGGGNDIASWLDWIPKVGIFGITLIGVVIWNVRKVSGKAQQQQSSSAGLEGLGFDDSFLKDKLSKNMMSKPKGKGDLGGLGGLGGLGASGEELKNLMAKAKQKKAGAKAGSGGASGSSGLGGLGAGLDLDDRVDNLAASTKEMEAMLASMGMGDDD